MLYYEKPYLKKARFKILERDGKKVKLNDTILYPGGGGQPPDNGIAICENGEFKIRHLGELWHEIDGECQGDEIEILLDWKRRFLLMRSHTAEHTFFRFLENKGARMGKINLGEESSIIFSGEISIEDILEAESATRGLIDEEREVSTFWIKKEEVKNYPELRIKLERIKENEVRVVKIEGHDLSACKGVHVSNLKEIEGFAVTWVRMGKKKEVKFVIGDRAKMYHFRASQELRKLMWKRNLSMEKIERYMENLEDENSTMKEALRELSKNQEFQIEICGPIELHHTFFPYADYKIVQRRAMEIANNRDAVVIYGIGESGVVCIAFNPKFPWARDEYLKVLESTGGKGGGRGNFLSGSASDPERFIQELKKIICEKAIQLHGDENGHS